MYRYDEFDRTLVLERVAQFREQVARRLKGDLTEEEFKPLRLMNGLYLQLHAYMLRVAVPYGMLSSSQMRGLAAIARRYDKGYGHFTTRQNIQYNWIKLEEIGDILEDLAKVEMHAIQTSGNCIRNVTADPWALAARDEIEDPRVYCEIIRQWSTFHPEFSFLPRKFKIAVTGAKEDRAAVKVHDIGLILKHGPKNQIGFEVLVGGGQGRSPYIAKTIREFLPKHDLLSYLEAILRVYNRFGRRDNIFKARIKILVHAIGIEEMGQRVEAEWENMRRSPLDDSPLAGGPLAGPPLAAPPLDLPQAEIDRIDAYFAPPAWKSLPDTCPQLDQQRSINPAFDRFVTHNTALHRTDGYAIVEISLKSPGAPPGDASDSQMEAIADLAETYSFDEMRVTHTQNLVLPHVEKSDLHKIWQRLVEIELAEANSGMISDIICCPGMDYCALATTRSIPVAKRISAHFQDLQRQYDIGPLGIKISGCINACGHHHVGHIGILGVDRRGEEYYQVSLGGCAGHDAAIGKIVGPAFSSQDIVGAIDKVVGTYLDQRLQGERFLDTWRRIGQEPFKENLYATH